MIKKNLSNSQQKFLDIEEMESPSDLKYRHLTDKISYYQQDVDSETQNRTDTFAHKIRLLDDKVGKLRLAEEAKMNVILI